MLNAFEDIPDIFSYMYNKYMRDCPVEQQSVAGFVEFAKKQLQTNPAINPTYLSQGFGVRFTNGDWAKLTLEPNTSEMQKGTSVLITAPQTTPGMHGVVDTAGIDIVKRH